MDEIEEFVQRHGYPDLEAGHRPVFVGIDTNLFPWRMQDALGVDPNKGDRDEAGRAPTNGFALATGVKEELDWHFKHYDTDSLTRALGEEFDRLSKQPAGDNRQGFLGLYEYRRLMADRRVDVVETGTGDDAIVEGYATYADEERNDLLLFSNDYGFVEDAREAGLLAQHVDISRRPSAEREYLVVVDREHAVLPGCHLRGPSFAEGDAVRGLEREDGEALAERTARRGLPESEAGAQIRARYGDSWGGYGLISIYPSLRMTWSGGRSRWRRAGHHDRLNRRPAQPHEVRRGAELPVVPRRAGGR